MRLQDNANRCTKYQLTTSCEISQNVYVLRAIFFILWSELLVYTPGGEGMFDDQTTSFETFYMLAKTCE